MYPDRLYELAFAFRTTKLWKRLYDSELFALTLPDGQTGYCSVMGMLGEHLSLALYVGNQGLDSYRLILEMYETALSPLKAQEFSLSQDCLQCTFSMKDDLSPEELASVKAYTAAHNITLRGANAFPQFVRYRPAHFPQRVSDEDGVMMLCAALEAALAVHEKLKTAGASQLGFAEGPACNRAVPLLTPAEEGFSWTQHPLPPKQPDRYPEPALDELLTARLRKAKKSRAVWFCDAVMIPKPCTDGGEPYFPYTLLYGDDKTETAQAVEPVKDYKSGAETLLRNLCGCMLENGVPFRILVPDERTGCLLKYLAETLHIQLTLQPENDILNEMEECFYEFASSKPLPLPESGNIITLDEEALLAMPDELFEVLLAMARQGLTDPDTEALLRELEKRRR